MLLVKVGSRRINAVGISGKKRIHAVGTSGKEENTCCGYKYMLLV